MEEATDATKWKYDHLFQEERFGSGNLDVISAKLGSLSAFL